MKCTFTTSHCWLWLSKWKHVNKASSDCIRLAIVPGIGALRFGTCLREGCQQEGDKIWKDKSVEIAKEKDQECKKGIIKERHPFFCGSKHANSENSALDKQGNNVS